MQIARWGNSLAVRLPAKLVEELGLKEGDEIEVRRAADGAMEVAKKPAAEEIFEKYRGTMPPGFKFDREDANKRGSD